MAARRLRLFLMIRFEKKAETHSHLLTYPDENTILYKTIPAGYLFDMLEKKYLYFNRVDTYQDDKKDSDQTSLEKDRNRTISFEKKSNYTAENMYEKYRKESYACCFSLNYPTIEHLNKYGEESPVVAVFHFGKLKKLLNETFINRPMKIGNALLHDFIQCSNSFEAQFYYLNYGLVKYGNFDSDYVSTTTIPNPIEYAFFKDDKYNKPPISENELRILISFNSGLGIPAINGSPMLFSDCIQFEFDWGMASKSGALVRFEVKQDFVENFILKIGKEKINFCS